MHKREKKNVLVEANEENREKKADVVLNKL